LPVKRYHRWPSMRAGIRIPGREKLLYEILHLGGRTISSGFDRASACDAFSYPLKNPCFFFYFSFGKNIGNYIMHHPGVFKPSQDDGTAVTANESGPNSDILNP